MFQMPSVIDIRYNRPSPQSELSNLYPRSFHFDGFECNSIEGVLMCLTIPSELHSQCCSLSGFDAMYFGKRHRSHDELIWKGQVFDRYGDEYSNWLKRLYYEAFTQDLSSKEFLLSTGSSKLIHSCGQKTKTVTRLTEREFCDILMDLRHELQVSDFVTFS